MPKSQPAPLSDTDREDLPTELVAISDLRPHPRNYRVHGPAQLAHIVELMRIGGVFKNIVVARDNTILMGHGVTEAAKLAGRERIPVRRLDVDPSDPRALMLVAGDNEIGKLAETDDAMLAAILAGVNESFGLLGTGMDDDSMAKMLASLADSGGKQAGNTDPDDIPKLPTKTNTNRGDLWVLGEHRLLCGDSTNDGDVARLMGEERAVLMATDPPYGVDYTDEQRVLAERAHGRPTRKQKWDVSIDNDDKTGADIQPFLESCFRAALANALAKKAAWYLWHAQMTQGFFAAAAAAAANLVLHRQIIWVKPSLLFGFGDYHWRHELAFYGWVKGQRPKFYGKRNQTTVWEVGNETSVGKRVHPTQKPVALFEIPMNNHTKKGDVCYEPFSGSGTQIIAGERMGRRVFAMEIDPKYADVAVKRWEDFTGRKAVLEHRA